MKKKIKSFIGNLLIKLIDEEYLVKKIDNYKIQNSYSLVNFQENSTFYPESKVFNLKSSKSSISIGENSHIRGELLIYPYAKELIIGSNCYIGINTIIRSGESIIIGNNVLIAHNVTIIDSDSHEIDAKKRAESFLDLMKYGHPKNKGFVKTSPITICDNVWISYNVSILKGVTIGEGAIIAAGSVVTKTVEPFTIWAGNPAKKIKNLN